MWRPSSRAPKATVAAEPSLEAHAIGSVLYQRWSSPGTASVMMSLARADLTCAGIRMRQLIHLMLCIALGSGCAAAPDSDRTLAVNVRGSVSVNPTSFSGYYIYEDERGQAVRRDLTGRGNFNDVFAGRRVLLVAVRRTSADGLIGLVITSDGDVVYDSGMQHTNELILYEADT